MSADVWEGNVPTALPKSSFGSRDSAGASIRAIQHHYDVGDDFYRLWLDPGMSYSAALFEDGDTLESAQIRKLDYHIEQARARGAARVLDVGCGWGSLLERMVLQHGVERAVGLTLSAAQHERVRAASVAGVSVHLESWREHVPEAPYDALISVGALEHFARRDLSSSEKIGAYREFFEFCHRSLRAGARVSLQTICYGTLRTGEFNPFIAEMIFPESDLPSPPELLAAADGLFEIVQLRNDRTHYRRTCREWYRNLEAQRSRAVELLGEVKVQHYEHYLRIAVASFATRALGLLRITFERLGKRSAYRRGTA